MDHQNSLNRRHFLKLGAVSTLDILFACHLSTKNQFPDTQEKQNLISEIKLNSTVTPKKLIDFYQGLLGLKVLMHTDIVCSFKAGNSILTFNYTPDQLDSPFYHFAFNIPEKMIRQAENWQLKRTTLIEPPDHLKDLNKFSKNIVHFRHWNAHSIFFYDPAGNVVEYIARHSIPNSKKGVFSTNDILYISEVGLIVENVDEFHQKISNHLGIKKYSTSSNQFLALGDELGLILLMAKHTKAVFRKGREREIYDTEVFLNRKTSTPILKFKNYPYHLYSI